MIATIKASMWTTFSKLNFEQEKNPTAERTRMGPTLNAWEEARRERAEGQ
jgi:hypothetical protein